VVGPLARTAADLERALDVLAGPDETEGVGYQLALPPPRHTRLSDYRVLVLDQHPVARVASDIRAGLDDLARRLETLGATVLRGHERLPDLAQDRREYGALLDVAMSRGRPGVQTVSAHEWMAMLDAQNAARGRWAKLFEAVDVVLAPVIGVTAFAPIEADRQTRTIEIDGEATAYFDQIGWAGIATYPNLPATAFPAGRTKAGLPYGFQAIGPYLEDRTTIAFAGLLEREFGGYQPPPGY
jgi:amidase